jgi:cation diffusion facilitator family transporter
MGSNIAEGENAFFHKGRGLALSSLGLNILFTLVKFLLYRSTGSSAIFAETIHSLTDVLGSLLVVGGIYLSGMKSERFPWGLYKIENIAAMLSAGLIFISVFGIAQMIYNPSTAGLRNLDITFILLCSMMVPVLLFARYEGSRAKELNSPSLAADAQNWKMDIAPLAVVAIGIAGTKYSYPVADRIAATIVLILVVRAGYSILTDSLKSLLDASVDAATLKKIQEVLAGYPQIKETASLHARNSGRYVFVTMGLRLSLKRLKDAHEIAHTVEREIKSHIPFVERVIIHYEPETKDYQRYAVPLAGREGAISEHFAKAPFIALWDRRVDGTVSTPEVLENPYALLEKGKGIKLAEFLVKKRIDIVYTKESFEGKGPEYVLFDADVDVKKTEVKNMKELMESKG